MVTSTIKMTAKQYLQLGEDPPGVRLELVNGEIAVSPGPTLDHAYTLLELASILRLHVKRNNLGVIFCDVDTVISQFDVRAPDILFVKKAKVPRLKKKAVDFTPDLCVEIISPSTSSGVKPVVYLILAASLVIVAITGWLLYRHRKDDKPAVLR